MFFQTMNSIRYKAIQNEKIWVCDLIPPLNRYVIWLEVTIQTVLNAWKWPESTNDDFSVLGQIKCYLISNMFSRVLVHFCLDASRNRAEALLIDKIFCEIYQRSIGLKVLIKEYCGLFKKLMWGIIFNNNQQWSIIINDYQ